MSEPDVRIKDGEGAAVGPGDAPRGGRRGAAGGAARAAAGGAARGAAGEDPGSGRDDWKWRRRIRARPRARQAYRLAVAVAGLLVVAAGLALVPLPGPGWVIVFAGLAIWATEFVWAQRLLHWSRARVRGWNDWMARQAWWVTGLAGLATVLVVLALCYGYLAVRGVPALAPDQAEAWLRRLPGL